MITLTMWLPSSKGSAHNRMKVKPLVWLHGWKDGSVQHAGGQRFTVMTLVPPNNTHRLNTRPDLASINCVLDVKQGILSASFVSRLFALLIKKCANPARSRGKRLDHLHERQQGGGALAAGRFTWWFWKEWSGGRGHQVVTKVMLPSVLWVALGNWIGTVTLLSHVMMYAHNHQQSLQFNMSAHYQRV